MTELAALGAGRRRGGGAAPVHPVYPLDWPSTIPYPAPIAAPYNAPTYAITPTADYTGSVVHPGVYDFGYGNHWRGYRYWMAVSGYWLENNRQENPHVLASNDGFNWEPPLGLVNPIIPAPPAPQFNSDPDIEYDPATDRLVVINRTSLPDKTQQTFITTSAEGVLWTTPVALDWTRYGPTADGQHVSPSIVRRGPGDWWLFSIGRSDLHFYYHRAVNPLGTWTGPVDIGPMGIAGQYPWHLDVVWHGGKFRALLDLGPFYESRPEGYRAGTWDGTSAAGFTWAASNFMDLAATGWDTKELYRAAFCPAEDGEHYRVWYSADSLDPAISWRTGLTLVPQSIWPT